MANGTEAWAIVEKLLVPLLIAAILGLVAWGFSIRDGVIELQAWKDTTHPLEMEIQHQQILTTVEANKTDVQELEEQLSALESRLRSIE